MEAANLWCLGALILAALAGYSLMAEEAWRVVRRSIRDCRGRRRGLDMGRYLTRGVPLFGPAATLFMRLPAVARVAQDCLVLLRAKGYERAQAPALVSCGLAAFLGATLLGTLLLGSAFSAVALTLGAVALAVFWVESQKEKRAQKLRQCVPDSIQAMKSCFQAGLSLEQTLAYLEQHASEEMAEAYRHALQALRLGCSAREALDGLRREINAPEFAFVMVALEVQHRTGGSLAAILQDAEDAARNQFELERSLRVQTAQARLSARVVSAMPLVLVGLFSLVTDGFLEPFFSSVAGVLLFVLALALQAMGVCLVRRTLKVKGVVS